MEILTSTIYRQADTLPDEVVEKILECFFQLELSSHEVSFLINHFDRHWPKKLDHFK